MEFLLFHEIGHIAGGHLEFAREQALLEFDSSYEDGDTPLRHILECDADMFAADITSAVHLTDKMADSLHDLLPDVPWSKRDFALITYFAAMGSYFERCCGKSACDGIFFNNFASAPGGSFLCGLLVCDRASTCDRLVNGRLA